MRTSFLNLALLGACGGGDGTVQTPNAPQADEPLEPCDTPEVPAEAQRRFGWDDGTYVSPGGRIVQPAGPTVLIDDAALDAVAHPTLPVAYVPTSGRNTHSLQVVDLDTLEVLQIVERRSHSGSALSADGAFAYFTGGSRGSVQRFPLDEAGLLGEPTTLEVSDVVAGLALDEAGGRLWVGDYGDPVVHEIDLETFTVTASIALSGEVWDLAWSPTTGQLYASDLTGNSVSVIDADAAEEIAVIELGQGPAGMAVDDATGRLFVAVSNGDVLAVIDGNTHTVTDELTLTELDLLDESGLPLGNSNVNDVFLDATSGRLFASRGADNAVSVVDIDSLEVLGAFPVPLYPTGMSITPAGHLAVSAWRGGEDTEEGALTLIDVDAIDLAATTDEVSALYSSPRDRFPFSCEDGFFPVPTDGGESPIEHVVLIVKENKTLDCLFGDLEKEGLHLDPEYLRWDPDQTINQRALIDRFGVSDNFYVNARESDSGHLYLTSTHLTHQMQWEWPGNNLSVTFPVQSGAVPHIGNFFTHLVDNGLSLTVYGEIVGSLATTAAGDSIASYGDLGYPGGPIVNYAITDEDKARYVVEQIEVDGLDNFTYILLPNDHTAGSDPGYPTPESMVADNDYAVGILVEAISNSEQWEETVIFILQDDPQGCNDHIAKERSLLLVVSPWARRSYVSPANSDFLSVFSTTERILGLPHLSRATAAAAPLWDFFTTEPDLEPFTALPRVWPEEFNEASALGADLDLDLTGPDRSAELFQLLELYRLEKMGRITRAEAERRLASERLGADEEAWEEYEEEVEEETFAYDAALNGFLRWAEAQGIQELELPDALPDGVAPFQPRRR